MQEKRKSQLCRQIVSARSEAIVVPIEPKYNTIG